jgi:hypothetical protein
MTLDEQFSALADGYRRRLLVSLETKPTRPARLLSSTEISSHEPTESSSHESTKISSHEPEYEDLLLRHVHLPKLVAHGYIDWNEETWQVTRGPKFDELRPLLRVLLANWSTLSEVEPGD